MDLRRRVLETGQEEEVEPSAACFRASSAADARSCCWTPRNPSLVFVPITLVDRE